MGKERDCSFDNLRSFLMFLVVVGHLIEIVNTGSSFSMKVKAGLYFWIYSFHMPAFIFLSGYFAKFSWKKVVSFAVMYGVFQILYIMFSRYVLNTFESLQFVKPYWILWYLAVLVYYYILTPLLDLAASHKGFVMVCAILLSLGVGFCSEIGYPYTLSRFIVFLPFYVTGYYAGRDKGRLRACVVQHPWGLIAAGIGGTVLTMWMFQSKAIPVRFLFGSFSYSESHEILYRAMQLVIAFSTIGLLLAVFLRSANRRIGWITDLGQSTISVFLLHGFILRYLQGSGVCIQLWVVPFLAAAIVLMTGNQYAGRLFQFFQLRCLPCLPKVRNSK